MNSNSDTLVSIIIPFFNAEDFISEAIESALKQTHQNIELILVDDGSSDNSSRIVQEYCKEDSRISLFTQKNAGVAAARNAGLAISKGQYLAILDADDLWMPEKLEAQLAVFEEYSNTSLVCNYFCIGESPEKVSESKFINFDEVPDTGDVFDALLKQNFFHASSAIWRRSCMDEVGVFRGINAPEDWDLWLRIAKVSEVRIVRRVLSFYRKYDTSVVWSLEFARGEVRHLPILRDSLELNEEQTKILNGKLLRKLASLAYRERKEGNFSETAKLHRQLASLKVNPLINQLKAVVFTLLSFLFRK